MLRQLDAIAPKVIVCLGATAAQTLLETNRGISQFRGQWLEFRGRKLMATYHPAYLLRNPSAKAEVWKDLQKVMAVLGLEVKGKSAEAASPPNSTMGVLLGLLTAFTWGSSDFLARFATHRIGTLRTMLYMQLTRVRPAYHLLFRGSAAGDILRMAPAGSPWAWGLFAGALNTVATLSLYRSFEIGKMAVVAPLSASLSRHHCVALAFDR